MSRKQYRAEQLIAVLHETEVKSSREQKPRAIYQKKP